MIDAHQRLAADRARALDDPRAAGARAGRLRGRDAAPGGERRGAAAGADPRRACDGIEEPVVFPAHPRTRRGSAGSDPFGVRPYDALVEPLGYLDFAALASQARVIVTDSGGLQKEAYWNGVPCVTARPSTEWVDTVEAGANVLVDDDPDRLAEAVANRRDAGRRGRSSTATGTPPSASRRALYPSAADMSTYDIAVIGAGYVGMPHAQTFAEAGKKVVLVDVVQDVVDAINRGESHIQDVPSEKLKPLVESGAIIATTDFAAVRRRRRDRDRRRRRRSRRSASPTSRAIESAASSSIAPHLRARASRRARVDHVPRHDPRGRPADPRGRAAV